MNTSLFHGDLVSSNRIIYTPTPFAKTSLLHLQEVGELQAQKPHTSKRTNLLSYLFFIVEAGSGTLHYNGECYTLSKGDCVFLDCKYSYSHCTSEDLWKLKWIHFYGPSMNEIYDKYIQRGGQPCFSSYKTKDYCALLTELYTVASSEDFVKDMIINEKISSLLTLLMAESWNPDTDTFRSNSKRNLSEVKNYLTQNYTRKITLDELADCHASNYSSHLRQIYRRLNSAAPLHYLYLRAVFYGTFFSVLLTILSDSLIVSFATENKKRKNSPDQSSFFLSTTSAVSRFLAGSMS